MAVTPNGGTQANGVSASSFEIIPPKDTPEYMWPAYFAALHWALGEKDITEGFTKATGISFAAPRTGLDALIDQATRYQPAEHFIRAFVPWFNENVWGKMEAGNG